MIWNIEIEFHEVYLYLISCLIEFGFDLYEKSLLHWEMSCWIHNKTYQISIKFMWTDLYQAWILRSKKIYVLVP